LENNKEIISPDTKRENRIPPGQRLTDKFPVLHYGSVPDIDIATWTFNITGLVEKKEILNLEEFNALPQVKLFSDIHCVTGWSKLNTHWEGVSSRYLKELVEISPEAKFVTIHAEKGFTTNLSLEDFFKQDVIFATKFDGIILQLSHGFPVRLVVPRLYFWKSAKWVTGVEFTKKEHLGFWETHGYHAHGDPWKEERYSLQM
jgi:DMSO/TMAO reductase YedYZ molybdopterin-dependent catalytic subunit